METLNNVAVVKRYTQQGILILMVDRLLLFTTSMQQMIESVIFVVLVQTKKTKQ
jgi:hypothetical protein